MQIQAKKEARTDPLHIRKVTPYSEETTPAPRARMAAPVAVEKTLPANHPLSEIYLAARRH